MKKTNTHVYNYTNSWPYTFFKEILIFNIGFACLATFDIQFANLLKYHRLPVNVGEFLLLTTFDIQFTNLLKYHRLPVNVGEFILLFLISIFSSSFSFYGACELTVLPFTFFHSHTRSLVSPLPLSLSSRCRRQKPRRSVTARGPGRPSGPRVGHRGSQSRAAPPHQPPSGMTWAPPVSLSPPSPPPASNPIPSNRRASTGQPRKQHQLVSSGEQ